MLELGWSPTLPGRAFHVQVYDSEEEVHQYERIMAAEVTTHGDTHTHSQFVLCFLAVCHSAWQQCAAGLAQALVLWPLPTFLSLPGRALMYIRPCLIHMYQTSDSMAVG